MDNFSFQFTPNMFAVVFAIAAVIQMLKRIPKLAGYSDWFPLLSCGLGVGGAFLQGIANPLIAGIIMGTIASGSYSLLKGVIPAPELGGSLGELDRQLTAEAALPTVGSTPPMPLVKPAAPENKNS